MKRLLKENKVLVALTLIIVVCIIIMSVALVRYFYGGNGKDVYGTRLTGIEEVKLSDEIDSLVGDALKDNKSFNEVIVNLKGKIIYINIDLKENLSLVDAQSLAVKSLDAFSEEEKSFYDIQIIVTTKTLEEKSSLYPFMGYKSAKESKVVWTNND